MILTQEVATRTQWKFNSAADMRSEAQVTLTLLIFVKFDYVTPGRKGLIVSLIDKI